MNGQSPIILPKLTQHPNFKSDLSLKGSSAQDGSLLWPKKVSNGEGDGALCGVASVQEDCDWQSQDYANVS